MFKLFPLPVAEAIDRLPVSRSIVVQAPPGTGKTTVIPPAMWNRNGGKVLVTAPRKVAVRAAANRVGVGYAVRGDRRPDERIEFLTPGVLLRQLLRDPELDGISTVILDEVHERNLDTDLLLGMLMELQELRDDLTLVAMSATLDAAKFADFMGADIFTVEAPLHPLEISYADIPGRIEGKREFYQEMARIAEREVAVQDHSALVFVPGVREVSIICEEVGAIPLHGQLTAREQDRALIDSGPRIIAATSIAESSLTVPGVRIVVDSGLSRVPRQDNARGMNGLVTVSAAKSSAIQRAGRAGREGPGTVIRCFSESAKLIDAQPPEILSSDLTQAALFIAAWGAVPPLLDTPDFSEANDTLKELGAIDSGITELGQKLVNIPADPRLGRALLACGPSAAATVSVLSDNPRGDIAQQKPRDAQRFAKLVDTPDQHASPGLVTALAFPQRIAKKMGDEYQLASGTRARLGFPLDSEWLAVADVSRSGSGAIIRAAAALSESEALEVLGVHEETQAWVDGDRVRAKRVRLAGKIELSSTPAQVTPELEEQARRADILKRGLAGLQIDEKLRDRLAVLHAAEGSPWPDVSDDALLARIDDWYNGSSQLNLRLLLPWPEASKLDELVPERIERLGAVDYSEGRPVVKVKLQKCFGMEESPIIAGQRVLFHLLSPAQRPLAVTDDLASFWSGPYAGVRADMRGRYPKHAWPEDPRKVQ